MVGRELPPELPLPTSGRPSYLDPGDWDITRMDLKDLVDRSPYHSDSSEEEDSDSEDAQDRPQTPPARTPHPPGRFTAVQPQQSSTSRAKPRRAHVEDYNSEEDDHILGARDGPLTRLPPQGSGPSQWSYEYTHPQGPPTVASGVQSPHIDVQQHPPPQTSAPGLVSLSSQPPAPGFQPISLQSGIYAHVQQPLPQTPVPQTLSPGGPSLNTATVQQAPLQISTPFNYQGLPTPPQPMFQQASQGGPSDQQHEPSMSQAYITPHLPQALAHGVPLQNQGLFTAPPLPGPPLPYRPEQPPLQTPIPRTPVQASTSFLPYQGALHQQPIPPQTAQGGASNQQHEPLLSQQADMGMGSSAPGHPPISQVGTYTPVHVQQAPPPTSLPGTPAPGVGVSGVSPLSQQYVSLYLGGDLPNLLSIKGRTARTTQYTLPKEPWNLTLNLTLVSVFS
ncbi:hypothetical protein Hypma_014665 [Hypsizygus marmoreus]|uniref:Uncharacterized protein n=1 Tax=Hypsizygus marmoreus TaxID=39966 RepID=A0A369JBK5_HYPMA|nr:hypothetical protein Hypma_014665 [Hypsizygus marmoreus]